MSDNNNNAKDPLVKATGLWETTDKNGNLVLSGNLGCRVVILKNTFKTEGSNQPDYQLFFAPQQRREDGSYDNGNNQQGSAQKTPEQVQTPF